MLVDPNVVLELFDLDITDLSDVAKIFAQYMKNSDLLLLKGKIGVGKTEFARLIIKNKASQEDLIIEQVSSPTFSLVQSYEFQHCKISHIDLYRVASEVELFELGIPDIFDSQVTLLEWPQILETKNIPRYVAIKIKETEELKDCRNFTIEFFGQNWDDLTGALLGSRHFKSEKYIKSENMDLIFYDFETTGKDPHWDQILQVGATRVTKEFKEIDSFESRCKLKPGQIPSAFALSVNSTDYAKLINTECTQYDMLCKIEEKFVKWSPSIFIGYNSINFDEEFLRNSLFRALLDPYVTSRNYNNRADLLELLRTVEFFFPDTLNIPINNKKKKSFRLDQIAPANSITHLAHDAFGDVIATKKLAQLISNRKPSLWRSFLEGSSKSLVHKTLSEEKMVFLCQTFYGKTKAISGTFLLSHPVYDLPVLFDLNYDPNELIELNIRDLKEIYTSGQKFLKFVKSNKSPILLKKNQIESSWFFKSINENDFQKRSEILEKADSFKKNLASMLLDIAEESLQEKELSGSQEDLMAEETLYTGGFPNQKDQKLKQQFRKYNWSNRYNLCQQFSDKRLSYFGLRLIYEECPGALPLEVREKIEHSVANQLTSPNKEKWKTFNDFDKEIEIIENDFNTKDKDFIFELKNIREYFEEIYNVKKM